MSEPPQQPPPFATPSVPPDPPTGDAPPPLPPADDLVTATPVETPATWPPVPPMPPAPPPPPPTGMVPPPMASVAYSVPRSGRPGSITAIGVISIVVACLSFLGYLIVGL